MECLKLANYRQKLPQQWTLLCQKTRASNSTLNQTFSYDNIGNRITSSNNDVTTNYSTNNLNQYENVGDFVPLFDADGNQTKIKTSKGEFLVEYNGENRPIKFTNLSDSTFITMKYDYMGRRGGKLHFNSQGTWTSTVKFFYKDYTLIEESTASNDVLKEFVWDPTAGQATKPLYMRVPQTGSNLLYLHDANKNVTEVAYLSTANGIGAHYEYDSFGNTITSTRNTRVSSPDLRTYNPFRFSSEYHDDELSLIYYNYRHYNPQSGRWINRDPIEEIGGNNLYNFIKNTPVNFYDYLGLSVLEFPNIEIGDEKVSIFIGRKNDENPIIRIQGTLNVWIKKYSLKGAAEVTVKCMGNIVSQNVIPISVEQVLIGDGSIDTWVLYSKEFSGELAEKTYKMQTKCVETCIRLSKLKYSIIVTSRKPPNDPTK